MSPGHLSALLSRALDFVEVTGPEWDPDVQRLTTDLFAAINEMDDERHDGPGTDNARLMAGTLSRDPFEGLKRIYPKNDDVPAGAAGNDAADQRQGESERSE
jgi:hypothetical protein